MITEVTVKVTVQVDTATIEPETHIKESARQAIENAVRLVEWHGFSHDMAESASVGVVEVTL